jgi:hypothetical protein
MMIMKKEKIYRKRKRKKEGAARQVLLFDTFVASTKAHGPYTLTVCTDQPCCSPELYFMKSSHRCNNFKVSILTCYR